MSNIFGPFSMIQRSIDFEDAFEMTGHGRINYWVQAASTLMLIHVSFEMVAVAYIITPAECDLRLTTMRKSMINSASFIGLCITSICAGKISDRLGRRSVMLPSALGAICLSFMSSLCSSFWTMFLLRMTVGFLLSATNSISMVYVGELTTSSHKDTSISLCFLITQISFVILPGFGFLILTGTWSFDVGSLHVRPWRTFMWLWECVGLSAVTILFFLPESPRFLAATKRLEKTKTVLAHMYACNFQKKPSDYPVYKITMKVPLEESKQSNFKEMIKTMLELFKPPMLKCFCISHACMFNVFLIGTGLNMWFPDLIDRIVTSESYAQDMCTLINRAYLTQLEINTVNDPTPPLKNCPIPHSDVYLISMVFELAFMVPFVTVTVLINQVSKIKLYSAISGISSVFVLISSVIPNLKLGIFFFALSPSISSAMGILTTLTIEAFPTCLRCLAITSMYMCGQLGAVVGTSSIAFMHEAWCYIIFGAIFIFGMGSGMCLLLAWPNIEDIKKQMEKKGFTY